MVGTDEVDALLGTRKAHEHEATTALKTEFMQLWDGMSTRKECNVCVLAATNRPFDLDEAILRRCVPSFAHASAMLGKKFGEAILSWCVPSFVHASTMIGKICGEL